MKKKIRVIVQSESDEVRELLAGLVEKDFESIVVGRAIAPAHSLNLARNLRPDIVIFGLRPKDRLEENGARAVEAIIREISGTRVLVIRDIDIDMLTHAVWNPRGSVSILSDRGKGNPTKNLGMDDAENPLSVKLYFQEKGFRKKVEKAFEEIPLFGTVGIIIGLMMMITGLLFIPGLFIATLGLVMVLLGGAARLMLRYFFSKMKLSRDAKGLEKFLRPLHAEKHRSMIAPQ